MLQLSLRLSLIGESVLATFMMGYCLAMIPVLFLIKADKRRATVAVLTGVIACVAMVLLIHFNSMGPAKARAHLVEKAYYFPESLDVDGDGKNEAGTGWEVQPIVPDPEPYVIPKDER